MGTMFDLKDTRMKPTKHNVEAYAQLNYQFFSQKMMVSISSKHLSGF